MKRWLHLSNSYWDREEYSPFIVLINIECRIGNEEDYKAFEILTLLMIISNDDDGLQINKHFLCPYNKMCPFIFFLVDMEQNISLIVFGEIRNWIREAPYHCSSKVIKWEWGGRNLRGKFGN